MAGEDDDQGARPGRPDVLRDVAAELRALRRSLTGTTDVARETAGVVSEIAPKVYHLEGQVAVLRGTVGKLVEEAEGTPAEDPSLTATREAHGLRNDPPGPWCWPLFDVEQATKAWQALARWVGEVLAPQYGITLGEVPDCWPRHPRMVAELSWCRQAYLEAHTRGAAATKAQDWHLRGLPGVLAAISGAIPKGGHQGRDVLCGPGHHMRRPTYEENQVVPPEERARQLVIVERWQDHWREAMAADLAGRRPAPEA